MVVMKNSTLNFPPYIPPEGLQLEITFESSKYDPSITTSPIKTGGWDRMNLKGLR